MPTNVEVKSTSTTVNGLSGAVVLAAGAGITLTPVGQTITIASTADLSTTLLDISANSTTAPNSIYNLTANIPVIFKSSDGNTMLYLDETNERVGIGNLTNPLYVLDVLGAGTAANSIAARFVAGTSNAAGGILLGARSSTYGGIWSNDVTPGSANYMMIGKSGDTHVNSTGNLFLNISETPIATITVAGMSINPNGSASNSPLKGIGTWFSGGTATTTKPYWLIEPTGTTSTAWSTSGTGLGINAASGFVGNLIDAQVTGTSQFAVNSIGIITTPNGGGIQTSASRGISFDSNIRIVFFSGPATNSTQAYVFGNPSVASSTSGTSTNMLIYGNYYPASGTGTYNMLSLSGSIVAGGASSSNYRAYNIEYTINNTGAQTGTATGLYISSVETTLNSMTNNLISVYAGVAGTTLKFNVDNAGLITTGSTTLIKSSVAFTNGAAAALGTMTNAPTAGDPTKWIPINDNGTTRYIPAW